MTPTFTVESVDTVNDVLVAEATFSHLYRNVGPWTATLEQCCRLSRPQHINNPDVNDYAQTIVNFNLAAASPVSSISPIVDCPKNATCRFQIPAYDPNGLRLNYRFATDAEAAGGTFYQPGEGTFIQPGASATHPATIDPTTGVYVWDTTGTLLAPSGYATYYSTQVMVESLVGPTGNTVASKTPVDFFIRLSDTASADNPPAFIAPTPADGTVYNVRVGSPLSINIAASDPDTGDTVTLAIQGKPTDATFAPTLANPATGTFNWTPTTAGKVILTLTAQDQLGLGAVQRSITINILPLVQSTTTVVASDAIYDGQPHGGTAMVTGAGGLNQSLTVSYSGRTGTSYGPSATAPTNAGDYTASASFAGDADYLPSSASKDFTIANAPFLKYAANREGIRTMIARYERRNCPLPNVYRI